MADVRHPATPLGASGLKVTKLWLGTMMFGDQTDETEAGREDEGAGHQSLAENALAGQEHLAHERQAA